MTPPKTWLPRSWAGRYVAGSAGGIVALLALTWALFGFRSLGLDVPGTIALFLGVGLTISVAVALMALIFYSNRSGRDDMVGGERYEHHPRPRA